MSYGFWRGCQRQDCQPLVAGAKVVQKTAWTPKPCPWLARFLNDQTRFWSSSSTSTSPRLKPLAASLTKVQAHKAFWKRRRESVGLPKGRMRCHAHIITTPTADTEGTGLFLIFDDRRYFFGQAHEGFQRVGIEQNAKFTKLREIFITGKLGTQTVGGLLGLVLTMATALKSKTDSEKEMLRLRQARYEERIKEEEDRQKEASGKKHKPGNLVRPPQLTAEKNPNLGIHGGPNMTHVIAAARSFIFRQGVPLKVQEFPEVSQTPKIGQKMEPTWTDDQIRVWALAVSPSTNETIDKTSRPTSLRKRSLDEYMDAQQNKGAAGSSERVENGHEEKSESVQELAVREMFESKWRSDNLEEMSLRDVDFPGARLWTRDPESKALQIYTGPIPGGPEAVPDIKVLVRRPWPGALIHKLPELSPSHVAMSYIVRNHRQRGKFKPAIAKALGVPSGPLYAKLANGVSVTSDNGQKISPDMVLEPSKEGAGLMVLDVPSSEYLSPLFQRPEWQIKDVMIGIQTCVWILGAGVAQDKSFQDFLANHSEYRHIISSHDHSPNSITMSAAASATVRHQLIDPTRYSTLQFNDTPPLQAPWSFPDSPLSSITEMATPGLKIQLEPKFEIQYDPEENSTDFTKALREVPEKVYDLMKVAKIDVAKAQKESAATPTNLPSSDADITCLGTGSAVPSVYRNVAGTLLRVPGYGSYIFDAGENTLGQLRRRFPPEELDSIFRDLKMIWISHLHADHHLGSASLIKAWRKAVFGDEPSQLVKQFPTCDPEKPHEMLQEEKRLFIVGHPGMMRWLGEYSSVEDIGIDRLIFLKPVVAKDPDWDLCQLLGPQDIDFGFKTAINESTRSAMQEALSLTNLVVCNVRHCLGSYGISVTFSNGFKFSYSGDCRPSKNFAAIGAGSTVLVHEATFDDELQSDAVAKKHSTISEAISVGMQMQAKNIILTHFSQRFSKMPTMDDIGRTLQRLQTEEQIRAKEEEEAEEGDEGEPMDEGAPLEAEKTLDGPDSPRNDSNQQSSEPLPVSDPENLPDAPPSISAPTKDTNQTNHTQSSSTPSSHTSQPAVAVAFDYMRVRVGDIQYLHHYTPAFRELYKEDELLSAEEKRKKEALSHEGGDDNETAENVDNKGSAGKEQQQQQQGKEVGQNKPKSKKQENRERKQRELAEHKKQKESQGEQEYGQDQPAQPTNAATERSQAVGAGSM